jgi:hypothetical protein
MTALLTQHMRLTHATNIDLAGVMNVRHLLETASLSSPLPKGAAPAHPCARGIRTSGTAKKTPDLRK